MCREAQVGLALRARSVAWWRHWRTWGRVRPPGGPRGRVATLARADESFAKETRIHVASLPRGALGERALPARPTRAPRQLQTINYQLPTKLRFIGDAQHKSVKNRGYFCFARGSRTTTTGSLKHGPAKRCLTRSPQFGKTTTSAPPNFYSTDIPPDRKVPTSFPHDARMSRGRGAGTSAAFLALLWCGFRGAGPKINIGCLSEAGVGISTQRNCDIVSRKATKQQSRGFLFKMNALAPPSPLLLCCLSEAGVKISTQRDIVSRKATKQQSRGFLFKMNALAPPSPLLLCCLSAAGVRISTQREIASRKATKQQSRGFLFEMSALAPP